MGTVTRARGEYLSYKIKKDVREEECQLLQRLSARSPIFPMFMGCVPQRRRGTYKMYMEHTGTELERDGSAGLKRGDPRRPLDIERLVIAVRLAAMAMYREGVSYNDWKGSNITQDARNQYRVIDVGDVVYIDRAEWTEEDAIARALESVFDWLQMPIPLAVEFTPQESFWYDITDNIANIVESFMLTRNIPSDAVVEWDDHPGVFINMTYNSVFERWDIYAIDKNENPQLRQSRWFPSVRGLMAYQRWSFDGTYLHLDKQENLSNIRGFTRMLWCLALQLFANTGIHRPIMLRAFFDNRAQLAVFYKGLGMHTADQSVYYGSMGSLYQTVCTEAGRKFTAQILDKLRRVQLDAMAALPLGEPVVDITSSSSSSLDLIVIGTQEERDKEVTITSGQMGEMSVYDDLPEEEIDAHIESRLTDDAEAVKMRLLREVAKYFKTTAAHHAHPIVIEQFVEEVASNLDMRANELATADEETIAQIYQELRQAADAAALQASAMTFNSRYGDKRARKRAQQQARGKALSKKRRRQE